MRRAIFYGLALMLAFVSGIGVAPDDNDKSKFGSLGLPVNCRAYVDASVAGYRLGKYTADETMAGLERNCGAAGQAWENNRD